MVCKKCGRELLEGEKFCTVCGNFVDDNSTTHLSKDNNLDIVIPDEPPEIRRQREENFEKFDTNELISINNINEDISSQPNNIIEINNQTNEHPETDMNENRFDRLLEAYVGEDYQEIVRKKINIYAFIFNLFYYLYRKLYLIGIIGLVILWVLAVKKPILIIPYIILVAVISGVLFNPIYLKIANSKIKRIKKNNPTTDDFELMEVCRKKGGVNVVIALVIYLLFIISIIGTLFSFKLFLNGKEKFWEENNNNRANCMYITKNSLIYGRSNGVISNDADILETVCRKFGDDSKYFDIYLKMKNFDGSISYLYFSTGEQELILNNNTIQKSSLESKQMNGTITEEEKKKLEEYKQIESDYNKIKTDSEKYEELLAKRKNKIERNSFVFTKEEVLR